MKRINVMVNDKAKDVLIKWKDMQSVTTLDDAMESLLIEFGNGPDLAQGAQDTATRKEAANHIDDLMKED